MRQESLFDKQTKKVYSRTAHGGCVSKGKRKRERPLSSRKAVHLVLKSEKAKGELSLRLHAPAIRRLIANKAQKFGVRLLDYANVGTHLHLKLRMQSRGAFQNFLRAITCLIARLVTKASRNMKFGSFWQGLAYTRVLKTRLEELYLRHYFQGNRIEAESSYEAREEYLKQQNDWVQQKHSRRASAAQAP